VITPRQPSDAQLRDCWRALESSSTVVRTRIQQQLRTETGLPAGWPDVLVLLASAPDHRQPMHVAARQTGLTSGGFTKLADRMQQAGLITRDHATDDRRIVYLTLTKHGAQKAADTERIQTAVLRRELAAISSKDLTILTKAIRNLR
jgi:DNA-binding MarR family transcriptional regulator